MCAFLAFSWWVVWVNRTSWLSEQGTVVPSDTRSVGDLGQQWHYDKSTDLEHVVAFWRPSSTSFLPSSNAVSLLSVKCKLFPWKQKETFLLIIERLKQQGSCCMVQKAFLALSPHLFFSILEELPYIIPHSETPMTGTEIMKEQHAIHWNSVQKSK